MLREKTVSVMEDDNFIMDEPVKGVSTEPMGLVNSGALVKRIYESAPPFAFVREFIKNSLQAGATRIEIGPDFVGVKTSTKMSGKPVYKLMFADNGEGIPRHRMKTLLNNLSSSGRSMAADGNFGIGAKVAALPWNPFGISFMSWSHDSGKETEGMVRLFRRPDGNFGLHRFNESDGDEDNFVDLSYPPDDYREPWQKPTGTSVVLLGSTPEEDTVFGPPEEDAGLYALIHVVNDRFFDIPDGVNISVCVFDNNQKAKWPKSRIEGKKFYRKANGSRYFLDKYSRKSGTIQSQGAKIHWWWHPGVNSKGFDSYTSPLGYIGALYDGELYNAVRKTTAKKKNAYNYALVALYAKFGLFFEEVWNHVTIVVEPDHYSADKPNGVFPDLARGQLRVANGDALPWDDWGKTFINNMPDPIKDAVDAASEGTENSFNLENSLKEYFDMMDIYSISEPGGSRSGGSSIPKRKAAKSQRHKTIEMDNGEYKPTKYNSPVIQWVNRDSVAKGVDFFQGKAAHYEEGANTLLVNKDFPLWKVMTDRWTVRYPAAPGVASKVREAVKYAYEAALVLRVVHIRKLRGKPDWNATSIDKALSNESLTLAVLGYREADSVVANRLKGTLRLKRLDRSGAEE
jgi:hypothetical protein